MGKWCFNCGKVMKHPEITHCSDECVLGYVKKSKSKRRNGKSVVLERKIRSLEVIFEPIR